MKSIHTLCCFIGIHSWDNQHKLCGYRKTTENLEDNLWKGRGCVVCIYCNTHMCDYLDKRSKP